MQRMSVHMSSVCLVYISRVKFACSTSLFCRVVSAFSDQYIYAFMTISNQINCYESHVLCTNQNVLLKLLCTRLLKIAHKINFWSQQMCTYWDKMHTHLVVTRTINFASNLYPFQTFLNQQSVEDSH